MKLLFFPLLLFFIALASGKFVVEIENGKIEGEEFENFYAYKGIRYAIAERYSRSKPDLKKWTDVKEFKKFGNVCAQFEHFHYEFIGDEDCLNLNVYVPKNLINASEPVPVIFFIHGGAFMFGGALYYGPENIMNHGKMILVTINYRLGILGFLSTEDEILPGNLGLKDQVEALKWVQRNIQAFNGDPSKVTTVGFSAGGASVHLHYMSKLSKGLFNNGISHSGVATNAWVLMENAREKAHKVAEYAGCPSNDHQEMLKCLRQKTVKDLVMLTKKFQPYLYNPFTPFGVVIEPESKHAFLTEHPIKILESGNYNKLPWLVSQTKDEGSYPSAEFYGDEKILNEINDRWEEVAPYILDFYSLSQNDKLKKQVSRQIKKFYMGDKEISRKYFQAFNDIISDRMFKSDAKISLKAQSKFSPSFMYYFNYKSLWGLGEFKAGTDIGISHGEDVGLIFRLQRKKPYSDDENLMTKNLIEMWYTFARTNLPSFNGTSFAKSKPDKLKYFEISSNEEFKNVEIDEYFGEVGFWNMIENTLMKPSKIEDEL